MFASRPMGLEHSKEGRIQVPEEQTMHDQVRSLGKAVTGMEVPETARRGSSYLEHQGRFLGRTEV